MKSTGRGVAEDAASARVEISGVPGFIGVDPRKISRAREILGAVSEVEAIEVALDLLVLDDAHRAFWTGASADEF